MDEYRDPETVEERFEDLQNYLKPSTHEHYVGVGEEDTYWGLLQEKLTELEEEARDSYTPHPVGLPHLLLLLRKERDGALTDQEQKILDTNKNFIRDIRRVLNED